MTDLFFFPYSFWQLFFNICIWPANKQWRFIWTGITDLLFMFYLLSCCRKLLSLSVWICALLLSLSYSSHHLVGACLVRAQPILAVQQPLVEGFLVVWGANQAKMQLIRTHSVPHPPQEGSDSLLRQVDSSPIYTRCLCIPAPLRSAG